MEHRSSGFRLLAKGACCSERCILLGNALVTPKASWLRETAPIFFPVKSEFVHVTPKDGLTYFWWVFLQSPRFLQSLPIGPGHTPTTGSGFTASHASRSADQDRSRKNPPLFKRLCGAGLARLCRSRGSFEFDNKVIHARHHTSRIGVSATSVSTANGS